MRHKARWVKQIEMTDTMKWVKHMAWRQTHGKMGEMDDKIGETW